MSGTAHFDVYDYLTFITILLVSVAIGMYHIIDHSLRKVKSEKKLTLLLDLKAASDSDSIKSKSNTPPNDNYDQKTSTQHYLTANNSMQLLPVTLSLLSTVFSSNAFLGVTAEIYEYGIQYSVMIFGVMIPPIIGAFLTGPFFAKHKFSSIFQYIELRFDSKCVRLILVSFYVVRNTILTAIYIYGPATTLTTMSSLNDITAICLIGFIATSYTAFGGIKAVIWTDVFQCMTMFVGLFLLIIKGK